MEKSANIKKDQSQKINLSNIYTEKEIESLKKIFPQLSSLIISTPPKVQKTKNKKVSFASSKINQYIEKEKFVKLITEILPNIFKGENSEILAKSLNIILKDNTGATKEEKKLNNRESAKITKNHIFVDFSEKPKYKEINVFIPKKIQKKNFFLDKCITEQNFSKKINSNTNLNMNNINNSVRNKNGRKILDIKRENEILDNKNKNNKSNSIINNFITFTNTPQTEKIMFSKNQINTFTNMCNNNTDNSTSNRKSVPNSKNINKLNSKSAKKNISPFKLITSYLTNEKLKSPRNKNRIKKINTSKSRKTDTYSTNFVKKIEKLKTEINTEKMNPLKRNKRRTIGHDKPLTSKINLTHSHLDNKIVNNSNQITLNKKAFHSKLNPNKKETKNIPDINSITKNNPIDSKDFNIFEFESKVGQKNTLLMIGTYIYKKFDFSKIIKEIKFVNWSKKIAAGYSRSIPYHTDLHASDVTQTCFLYLLQDGVKEISQVDNIDICCLILSCICHDFKHGGLNNNFLRLTKDKLAVRYNDISILENMHISETFKLINTYSECDIFNGVDKNTYEKMRKKMIFCVLSTDMANHSKHMDFMKKVIANNNINNNNNKNKEEDNQEFLNLLIHSADISNPTKPFNIYLKWAKLVVEEFCQQGDKEKELGLVCTNDRNTIQLSKNQIGFIDYVVEGFNSSFIQVYPSLKFLHDQIVENREKFVNYKDEDNNNDQKNNKLIKK